MSTENFTVKKKTNNMQNMSKIIKKSKTLAWDEVEGAIRKEIKWLKNTI